MSEPAPETGRRAARAARAAKPRRRVSVIGVLGELLITAGVLILLFLGWQLWWNDAIMAGQQSSAAGTLSQQWTHDAHVPPSHPPVPTTAPPTAPPTASPPTDYGPPVVDTTRYDNGQSFAIMFVPRFGPNSQRTIAQGYGLDVLNSFRLGVGHYPSTQMPGEVGNFAIASHRSAYGGGMHKIEQLQLGDGIYIQTKDGWFTYRFRDFEYVPPSAVDVLAPVPRHPGMAPKDRIITLTTCNPLFSTAERIAAYGVLESWRPASAGPPPEIAAAVANWGK